MLLLIWRFDERSPVCLVVYLSVYWLVAPAPPAVTLRPLPPSPHCRAQAGRHLRLCPTAVPPTESPRGAHLRLSPKRLGMSRAATLSRAATGRRRRGPSRRASPPPPGEPGQDRPPRRRRRPTPAGGVFRVQTPPCRAGCGSRHFDGRNGPEEAIPGPAPGRRSRPGPGAARTQTAGGGVRLRLPRAACRRAARSRLSFRRGRRPSLDASRVSGGGGDGCGGAGRDGWCGARPQAQSAGGGRPSRSRFATVAAELECQ